jgi:sulfate adenylyltransferase subunit 2
VPLYFSAERPVVIRDGLILVVDDERFRLTDGEEVHTRRVRFRTLGCYPLTGAVDSEAADLSAIVAEMERATTSERQGRAIDRDGGDHAMERKKLEGYF